MSFPVPSEQDTSGEGGWVRHYNRRHIMPTGGELSVPFATAHNGNQVAPGLPIQKKLHRNHAQVYGEHKEAFANHVGTTRRGTMGVDTSSRNDHLHYSKQGGFARKQRDLEKLRERTRVQHTKNPKQVALQQAANRLASSDLNTKSLFQHFDRNRDGTINFNSFSNGLRLAGVTTPQPLQRELFDSSARNGRLDYKKFVDDMKIKAYETDQKTSLDIDDPTSEYVARKEETSRNKLYGLGFQSGGGDRSGQNGNTKRRLAWNDMSKSEQHAKLVRGRVMRRLQEQNDKVEAAFVSVDKQRDGCLNKTEFQEGLKRVGITLSSDDATSFFNELPRGNDGLLDYHKFAKYLHQSNVGAYSVGQVRSTNYTKEHSQSHIVQQRVKNAVAEKKKDLEIVFHEKDQGRGGRDTIGRNDGQVTIMDVDDVLKSCGVILSVPDTERLFDRVDIHNTGLISYNDFLKCTCGEYAVDLGESTETKKKRVQHLRSWNAISGGNGSKGELPEDLLAKEQWQASRRASLVSVNNPANVLQKKERNQLVTQQRIVDLYAQNATALKEVFDIHSNETIDFSQFLRGTKLAGIQIAPSDAEKLFNSIGNKDPTTGRTYINGNGFVQSLQQYSLETNNTMSNNNSMSFGNPMDASRAYATSQEKNKNKNKGFGAPPPLPTKDANATPLMTHSHYSNGMDDNAKTEQWNQGDALVRQERLASEKVLRKITEAADPHHGSRPSLTLQKAFSKVNSMRDGFVDMNGFQEGMSHLGIQLSRFDCRQLFSHFDATESDTISIHSLTALLTDRQRSQHLQNTKGVSIGSERLNDSRILIDAWGVPAHDKMATRGDNYQMMQPGIQAGKISNMSVAKDVKKRLRVICPQDPESARQYLLYVFRKHDDSGRKGTISHNSFTRALNNFDNTFNSRRINALIDICDANKTGRINYYQFVDQVLNVDKAQHEQIARTTGEEKSVKWNDSNSEKKKARLDWTKHRWQKFQNSWAGKHGRAAVKEMQRDASVQPSGVSWSSAPQHKQPFRVLHSSIRAPPSPIIANTTIRNISDKHFLHH